MRASAAIDEPRGQRYSSPLMTNDNDVPPEDDESELPEQTDSSEEHERRRLLEIAVPEVIRRLLERALESGVEKISEGPENLRGMLSELKLPKEALHYVYGQIDDTKKGIYRVVAKEIRDVLEHTKFSDEIADVLTKLSFEINTQIRFVPNPQHGEKRLAASDPDQDDAEAETSDDPETRPGIPRPRVVSKVVMRARDRLDRRTKDRSRAEKKDDHE